MHIHVLSGNEQGSRKKAVFSDWVRRKRSESFISNDVQAFFFLPSPERWQDGVDKEGSVFKLGKKEMDGTFYIK